MSKVRKSISELFGQKLNDCKLTFLFNSSEYNDYSCLYSDNSLYKKGEFYDVYSISSLMRVLLTKTKMVSTENILELYQSNKEICYILDWKNEAKKVILFNFSDSSQINQSKLYEILEDKRKIEVIFQEAYAAHIKEKSLANS